MDDVTHRPPAVHFPRHTRNRVGFEEIFGRSAYTMIAAMDAAGDDVADQVPHHPIALRRMGVDRRAIPVTIADPFDSERSAQLSCAVSVSTGLEAGRRGIHVSRIGDVLARLSLESLPSLPDYAAALSVQVARAHWLPAGPSRYSASSRWKL